MSDLQYDHWTRDESLLEEYVLGRIGPPRREQLEEHLAGCDECRGVVAKEQRLAAGVRRAGRAAMKQRLDQRLIQRTHVEIGWYRTAGIAAGIVLLITIGIYGKWFFGGEESATASRETVDQIEKEVKPAPENMREKYERETDPLYAASRLWINAIIDPRETRRFLSLALEAAAHRTDLEPLRTGVFQT